MTIIKNQHKALIKNLEGKTNHCHNCRYLYMDGENYMCSSWQGKNRHNNLTEEAGAIDAGLRLWLGMGCDRYGLIEITDFQLF